MVPLWVILLAVAVAIAIFIAGAFILAGVASRMPRAGGDTAPGWRVRCPGCGRSRPASEAGVVRIGARGNKRILVRCGVCERLRWAHLERDPEHRCAAP